MENESWKDIKGYEGLYQVSNLGRVKSCHKVVQRTPNRVQTYPPKILKQEKAVSGYKNICITHNKKKRIFYIHRLVAQAFLSNPDNKQEVNHKNGVKDDNRLENLEWCTKSENIRHSYNELNHTRAMVGKVSAIAKKVRCEMTGKVYDSVQKAADANGIPVKQLYKKLSGERKNTTSLRLI